VPPLSLPDAAAEAAVGAASACEAVALFVDRARAAAPRFELDSRNVAAVIEICRRLDGLPLALELAAARVRALTPEEIARRIGASLKLLASSDRAADPRHQTLDAAIGWSYRLLEEAERKLLARLSVFVGSFSLEQAEKVCADDSLRADALLDVLTALVDKSLVLAEPLAGDSRFRLLETVRQFGADRLEIDEREALRQRHAAAMIEVAEEAAPQVFGGAASSTWMARLEAEIGNLRAAVDWSVERPERVEVALRLGTALHWFWFARGRLREGQRTLARALAASDQASPARARALIASGQVAFWQADHEAVRPAIEAGVAMLSTAPADDFWRAYAVVGLAVARTFEALPEAAAPVLDEAVAAARRHRHTALLPLALYWRARARGLLGDHAGGLEDALEGVALSRGLGNPPVVGHGLLVAGRLLLATGEVREAGRRLDESLAIHFEIEEHWGLALGLEGMAFLAVRRRQPERAVALLAASARLWRAIGSAPPPEEE
jgi:non-specific serine/threonine protein kinase